MAPAGSKTLKAVFSYQSWVHAISGASGSVVAMTAFYPLDNVRHRLQLEDPSKKKRSTFEVLNQILREEGVGSLYRGLVPVLQSLCISNFVYFYTFHSLKALNPGKAQALRDLLLGMLAGAVNVMSTTPFWVVNTRLKVKDVSGTECVYDNLLEGLVYIAKTEGITSLWSGAAAGLVLVVNPAIQFMTYEAIKRQFILRNPGSSIPAAMSFAFGAVAKAVATVLTYPLQLVQTRLRHGAKHGDKKQTIIKMMLQIFKTQGLSGLFRGLEAKLLQTVLTAALMFMTYEKIAKFVTSLLIKNHPRLVK